MDKTFYDKNGTQIQIGDTVRFNDEEYTVVNKPDEPYFDWCLQRIYDAGPSYNDDGTLLSPENPIVDVNTLTPINPGSLEVI